MNDPRIQLAVLLINLGLTTAMKVREALAADEDMDDATLDGIMSEVDRRIARRASRDSAPS